jgi:hypothetical protein
MSIHTRILLPFGIALIGTSLIAWWLATALMADTLSQRVEDQIERAASQLVSGQLPLSQDLLDRLGALLGVDFVLMPAAAMEDVQAGSVPSPVHRARTPRADLLRSHSAWRSAESSP